MSGTACGDTAAVTCAEAVIVDTVPLSGGGGGAGVGGGLGDGVVTVMLCAAHVPSHADDGVATGRCTAEVPLQVALIESTDPQPWGPLPPR